MYSFREIRDAIVSVEQPPENFPYGMPLTVERLQQLRNQPEFQGLLADIRQEAERASVTPIAPLSFSIFQLFETTGARREFERPYFERRGRLLGLVLASLIDQTDLYMPALNNLVWEICNEYTWSVPAHLPVGLEAAQRHRVPPEQVVDLFAAETSHALAESLFLLDDLLDPWMHYRIRNEIERRIFQPIFHDPVHFHWEAVPMNWASVCAGAAGMAALLLVEDRERLAGMVERVLRAMECFLEGYAEDGGCPEGIGYWQYGFGYYVYFVEMLYQFTSGRLDLLQGEKIRRIAAFPTGVSLADNNFISYSDAASRSELHTGLVCQVVRRTGAPAPQLTAVPSLHRDHCYRWGHATRNLLWTDAELLGRPTEAGTSYFPDLAWVVSRRYLNETMVAFSAKGGHNAEPHNHNDLGNFILHIGGEDLLADLGAGVYTREYFGPKRYTFLHNASFGHSVPVINDQQQQPGREYEAIVLQHEQLEDRLLFSLDLTRAYDLSQMESFVRSFDWVYDAETSVARLELTDTFAFTDPPSTIEEAFISLCEPVVEDARVTWTGERGTVTLEFDPQRLRPSVAVIASQDHHANPITVYRLSLQTIHPQRQEEYRFVFVGTVVSSQ